MTVTLFTLEGKEITVNRFTEFNLTQSVGVACDSLWVRFPYNSEIGEVVRVQAYKNSRLIFSGYCDCQRNIQNENGFEIYLYARSSACVLVDNEAEPFTYECPTAKQLFRSNAEELGFTSSLPELESRDKYRVEKGVSRFGAIGNFVFLLSGNHICVTPENEIRVLELSSDIKSLNCFDIASAVQTVNRSEPYSRINFKQSSGEGRYSVHTESRLSRELGINRTAYINLSALPKWQRENAVLQRLKGSFDDYKILEIKACGYVKHELFQRFSYNSPFGIYEDYALTDKKYTFDKNGEMTRLTLKKINDIKEITYVD